VHIKNRILKIVQRFPNALNSRLLHFNRSRQRLFGKGYSTYCDFLSRNRLHFDNRAILLSQVNSALRDIAYYRQRYSEKPVASIEEFETRIGTIDKDVILDNFDNFINKKVNINSYNQVTTGGTSGKPLRMLLPTGRYVVELATMHSLWSNIGFEFQPRAVIRNHHLPEGKVYQINPVTKEYIFDGFRLNDEYFRQIYEVCRKKKLQFFHCYPSTAYEFCCYLDKNKLDVTFIRAFFSGSENIFDYQVDLIEKKLGIQFYNWYGHSEKLLLGGYCAENRLYHIEPTYGYFELLDERGQVIRETGRRGEIVGTSFHNPGMPFIRYRTGDYAELYGFECPDCGRKLPLIKNIHGRWSGERIYNTDGSFITITALNLHSDLYKHINGFQYVQEKKGHLRVLVVKGEGFQATQGEKLLRHFQGKLNQDTSIKIEYVDRLIRKPNGKFVQLLSSL
jgi:phenylacetate-CoA ligase